MGFLLRLVPYVRLIGIVAAIVTVISGVLYIRHLWVEAEIAQRSHAQLVQQLDAATEQMEAQREKYAIALQRLKAAEEAANEFEDAEDIAPDSTRELLNSLYNND